MEKKLEEVWNSGKFFSYYDYRTMERRDFSVQSRTLYNQQTSYDRNSNFFTILPSVRFFSSIFVYSFNISVNFNYYAFLYAMSMPMM